VSPRVGEGVRLRAIERIAFRDRPMRTTCAGPRRSSRPVRRWRASGTRVRPVPLRAFAPPPAGASAAERADQHSSSRCTASSFELEATAHVLPARNYPEFQVVARRPRSRRSRTTGAASRRGGLRRPVTVVAGDGVARHRNPKIATLAPDAPARAPRAAGYRRQRTCASAPTTSTRSPRRSTIAGRRGDVPSIVARQRARTRLSGRRDGDHRTVRAVGRSSRRRSSR